jgi:GTP cyclohydrolase II
MTISTGIPAAASIRARVPVSVTRATRSRRGAPMELVTFEGLQDGEEHIACVWPPVRPVPLARVHSECLTGDVFGSMRCDCGAQLDETMDLLAREGGILLYMRQEGRGIGLYNKLDTYLVQDQGADTFQANRILGHKADDRDYAAAAQMLFALGIRRIRLITNNPEKIRQLGEYGVELDSVRHTAVHVTPNNRAYLRAKARIGRHFLRGVAGDQRDLGL